MIGKLRNQSDRSNTSAVSTMPGVVNKEYFWACDLTADKRSQKWHIPNDELEDDDEDYIEHTLVIRSVCLGAGAVEKEENVVVMESVGEDGEVFKGTIANLTKGVNSMVGNLSLTVDGKCGVTFSLVEGSGPISICGNRLMDYPEDDLDASQTDESLDETENAGDEATDEEEDEEDESFVEVKVKPKQAAKRKAPVTKAGKGKQKAKMEEEDEDDDDDDDDEEEEESDSDIKVKKAKKDVGKATAKGKAKNGTGRIAQQMNVKNKKIKSKS